MNEKLLLPCLIRLAIEPMIFLKRFVIRDATFFPLPFHLEFSAIGPDVHNSPPPSELPHNINAGHEGQ
jgi:hypothetical protein